jgi:hypothetical protein
VTERNPDGTHGPEHVTDEGIELRPIETKWVGPFERIAQLKADLQAARERELQILVAFYDADYRECGRVCDEVLDRSGALLERVRLAAHPAEEPSL